MWIFMWKDYENNKQVRKFTWIAFGEENNIQLYQFVY